MVPPPSGDSRASQYHERGYPMFKLTPTMRTAIQAFVDDAIAKQKAGTCGK